MSLYDRFDDTGRFQELIEPLMPSPDDEGVRWAPLGVDALRAIEDWIEPQLWPTVALHQFVRDFEPSDHPNGWWRIVAGKHYPFFVELHAACVAEIEKRKLPENVGRPQLHAGA